MKRDDSSDLRPAVRTQRGLIAGILACLWALGTAVSATAQAEKTAATNLPAAGLGVVSQGTDDVVIRPGLQARLSWHSNPYYRRKGDDIRKAVILSVEPSLEAEWPLSELLSVELYGKLGMKYYWFEKKGKSAVDQVTLPNRSFADNRNADSFILQPYIRGKIRYNVSEETSLSVYDDFQTANVDDVGQKRQFYLNNAWLEGAHDFSESVQSKLWYRNTLHFQDGKQSLFNFSENAAGGALDFILSRLDDGRAMSISPTIAAGIREFDEEVPGGSGGSSTSTNPKDHTYYNGGAVFTYPFSSLITLYLRGGWEFRDYEEKSGGRDQTTQSPWGGVSLAWVPSPGHGLSMVLAGSYKVEDTVVYNIDQADRPVFESTDALLNELNITYRELKVWRAGLEARYDVSRRLRFGGLATFQRSEADTEEDVASISGYTRPSPSSNPSPTQQDEVAFGGSVKYMLLEHVGVGLGYQHGFATENKATIGGKDVYEYDIATIMADVVF